MRAENPHLSVEQARHLTIHGIERNENGTYSWKFDNYVRATTPYQFNLKDAAEIWSHIECPDAADSRRRVMDRRLGEGRPHQGLQERRDRDDRKSRPLGASRSAR